MVPSSSWYHQHICMVHTNNLRRKCCVVMLGNNKKIYLRKYLHHLITADEALINFFLSPKQKFSLKCEENQEKNYWWTQKCLNRWVKLWSSLFETEKKNYSSELPFKLVNNQCKVLQRSALRIFLFYSWYKLYQFRTVTLFIGDCKDIFKPRDEYILHKNNVFSKNILK